MAPLKQASILFALCTAAVVQANDSISGDQFINHKDQVAAAAAPLWFFDEKSCAPGDATDGKGGPNGGNAPDNCNVLKTDHNCTPQPKKTKQRTEATSFPTYYTVRYCDGDKSWRVAYDVYFTKDTGHRNDWEWAAIRFVKPDEGSDNWVRDGIWMERDGQTPYKKWNEVASTFNDGNDMDQDNNKDKNRPKLYFGKWHHPVFDTPQTKLFPNTCPPTSDDDYRSDDYMFDSTKSLTPDFTIDPKWNYGSADSSPPSFWENGKHDICRLSMDKAQVPLPTANHWRA